MCSYAGTRFLTSLLSMWFVNIVLMTAAAAAAPAATAATVSFYTRCNTFVRLTAIEHAGSQAIIINNKDHFRAR